MRADSQETIIGAYSEIADLLQLPERVEQDQSLMVVAVQRWFQQHRRYLLILDNADDLAVVQPFLPTACPGHVVLTTRTQHLGKFAQRLEMDTLKQEAGAVLLLRRAGLIGRYTFLEGGTAADQALALTLTVELGGLPLALDQAGAYIEVTRCSLADYQQEYQVQRAKLLALRDGPAVLPGVLKDDHPEPVATTWSLSFAKVEQASPIAAELLRACAFLAPDAIPEELLVEVLKTPLTSAHKQRGWGGWFSFMPWSHSEQKPSPPIKQDGSINEAVAILRSYSLILRNTIERTFSVHRLVQVVVRDSLPTEIQRQWMQRAIHTVEAVHPGPDVARWASYERLLPHALVCATWIEYILNPDSVAAHLLNQAGYYLNARGRYGEAEPLYLRALAIRKRRLGSGHPDTAQSLNNLAICYDDQGKYAKVKPLLVRGLAIRERRLGSGHPDTAQSLNNLASLYQRQGQYVEAESLYQRALLIDIRVYGENHPDVAIDLNNLASLYQRQGQHVKAESLRQRVLLIDTRVHGEDHPDTATSLNNLGYLYMELEKYADAEPLLVRALAIREQQLGAEHPDTANSLSNLGGLYKYQEKYAEAEVLFERTLRICETALGRNHPKTATSLNNLAEIYREQGRDEEAEPLYKRALTIWKQELGDNYLEVAVCLNNLALLYGKQERDEEAEALYEQALAICEPLLGRDHPYTQAIYKNYARLLL